MTKLQQKQSLVQFIQTCTPLLIIPELETKMKSRVQNMVDNFLDFEPVEDEKENLINFLRKDDDFLGIILALANLSQEKFLRIISARRFTNEDFGNEWNIEKIRRKIHDDDDFVKEISSLLLEGNENAELKQILPDFYLDQLSLPNSWINIIQDNTLIGNFVRKKLAGEYVDLKGEYVEELARSRIQLMCDHYGFTQDKGQVTKMGLGKEVDIAIPSVEDPFIMIMISYMETTSSNQTTRANEQTHMYEQITHQNVRHGEERILVNIVDGGGWLARRSDLGKLQRGCDYILNINSLDQIEPIILRYLPKKFFTLANKPESE